MTTEQSLNYFHGALPDEDADKLLVDDGDFLLQYRYVKSRSRPKLFLAVKKSSKISRLELLKSKTDGSYTLLDKSFPDPKSLIEYYLKENIETTNETFILKKAIPRGKFQLGHRDIRLLKKIGAGAYGTVYKGQLVRYRLPVAVKRIDSDGKDSEALTEMMMEARVMQLYNHKNIVKFYGFIIDRAPYLLVMELCPDGSVEDKLRSRGREIPISRRVDMSAQAGQGLKYLHHKQCIHRDIATRNCLLAGKVLKLCDFGMCRPTAIFKVDLSKPQNVRWLAPEVWRTGETKFCTDIYAFAIMLWELFEQPYTSPYNTWKAITVKERVMDGYRMPIPESMPPQLASLMQQCWDHDPNKRPTASEMCVALDAINKEFNDDDVEQVEFKCTPLSTPTTKTAYGKSMMVDQTKSVLGNDKTGIPR